MKKALILAIAVCMFCLSSCKGTEIDTVQPQRDTSMFVEIEITQRWIIVYHEETKVMYAVSRGKSSGEFTLLVNADGTPMLYQDE